MTKITNETIKQIQDLYANLVNSLKNDSPIKKFIEFLINVLESLFMENQLVKLELQQCKDEIAKLKGEKGKPNIKPSKKVKAKDIDDDPLESQNSGKVWHKGSKKDKIEIDREEVVRIDKSTLPADAQFKGYEDKIIQDIVIKTDNVLYKCEKYYSPSLGKTYTAELPVGLQNTDFGPNIKALIVSLYFEYRIPENKIAAFLNDFGIIISDGTLSDILIQEEADVVTQEKNDIFAAGLDSTTYQQIDDTGMRVAGQNCYATIVCNPFYSAYFINPRKNRETVKNILNNGGESPVFPILVGDEAGQFDEVTKLRGLCWVHEFRHYRKIRAIFIQNINTLNEFKQEIREYYEKLKQYKLNPSAEAKAKLSDEFDALFSTITGYDILDERIALTITKKAELLLVLDHPEIPLHNNLSETGLRELVLKRKISFGTRTKEGTTAWENYMTISATCKKLGIKFFYYLKDIFTREMKQPRLANLIKLEAQKLQKLQA